MTIRDDSQEDPAIKAPFMTLLAAAALFALGCAPADQPPAAEQPTPAATESEKITDMDFESGDVSAEVETGGEEQGDQPE